MSRFCLSLPVVPLGLTAAFALAVSGAPLRAADLPALRVEVVTAHTAPIVRQYELSGSIAAAESFAASFREGGRVILVAVQAGDQVVAGQVLAQIDPTQASANERAAQAGLVAAQASEKQAQLARDRAEALANRGAGTRAALDAATHALLAAQSARDQAQAQLDKAHQTAVDTVIHAASDAVVTARSAEPGQIVGPAQAVLTLARDGAREAIFYAPDTANVEAFAGKTVHLSPLDGAQRELTAQVVEISPLADPATGTMRVKARLDPVAPGQETPALGAAVVGRISLEAKSAISLPWTAMAQTAKGPAVWRVDPGDRRVALVPVTIQRHGSQVVEISSGLAEGDVVVAAGSQLLYPGRVVSFEGDAQ